MTPPGSTSPTTYPRLPFRTLFVVCGLTLLVGCGDDPSPVTPVPEEPRTIERLLQDWESSYAVGDAETYSSVLSDDFVFVPDPEDVRSDPDFPVTWDRSYEVMCLGKFHEIAGVDTIDVYTFGVSIAEPDSADGTFDSGVMKVSMYADVHAEWVDSNSGEHWRGGGNGEQWLFIRQNPERLRAGEPMWEIFEWRESRNGFPRSPRIIPSWGWGRHYLAEHYGR